MDDLVQWLGEQLDEEERVARLMEQQYPSPWELADRGWMAHVVADGPGFREVVRLEQWHGQPDAWLGGFIEHVAFHDPARVLREIDADRQLLAQYAGVAANDVDDVEYAHGWANALGLAVRLCATKYSDRPGYREEWRP